MEHVTEQVSVLRHTLSVVVPVYAAGAALHGVVTELLGVAGTWQIATGVEFALDEVLLVVDNPGMPVAAREAVRALEELDPRIRSVWLSRNFGQHPATVAGIVSSNGDWVLTMDEDGQHDPQYVPDMLRTAAAQGTPLVYAKPTNPPPHGAARNYASRGAKILHGLLTGSRGDFHSFRLIEGPVARSACAYIGDNVYLDVAMRWSCGEAGYCGMPMRAESSPSSYNLRKLLSHFWRMVLSTGTRPLRLIAVGGVVVALLGIVYAAVVVAQRVTGAVDVEGWSSVMVALLVLCGGLFLSIATLAEYVGFAVRNAVGKPLYVKVDHYDMRVLWQLQSALERVRELRERGSLATEREDAEQPLS